MAEHLHIIVHLSIGGTSVQGEKKSLMNGPQVVCGTPGRVLSMMKKKWLATAGFKMFVIDEADEILNRGFQEEIDELF
jgi:superfamily II DNA/RNA helicase